MKTQPAKRKTIVLTGRSPVSIDPKTWPVLLEVWDHDGTLLSDANTVYTITVRQRHDGTRIVYGSRKKGPGGQSLEFRPIHWGKILQPNDRLTHQTIIAIGDCAEAINCLPLGGSAVQHMPAEEL